MSNEVSRAIERFMRAREAHGYLYERTWVGTWVGESFAMNTTYEAQLKVSIQKAAREAHKEGFTPKYVAMHPKTIKDMRCHLDLDYESQDVKGVRLVLRYRALLGHVSQPAMLEVVEDERLEEGEAKVCTRESAFVLGYVEGL